MGQFTRRGPVGALQKLCPFFQGNSHFYLPLQTGLEQRDIRKEQRIQKYDGKGGEGQGPLIHYGYNKVEEIFRQKNCNPLIDYEHLKCKSLINWQCVVNLKYQVGPEMTLYR